jgi:hypothetical protein
MLVELDLQPSMSTTGLPDRIHPRCFTFLILHNLPSVVGHLIHLQYIHIHAGLVDQRV